MKLIINDNDRLPLVRVLARARRVQHLTEPLNEMYADEAAATARLLAQLEPRGTDGEPAEDGHGR